MDMSSSEEEEESPPKKSKTENDVVMDVDQDDSDNEDVADDDDEDQFYDAEAHEEPEEMDVEMEASSPDENRKPPAKTLHGITLSFLAGPLKGRVFNMIKGENETVIVGSNPVAKGIGTSVLQIADDSMAASHVQLQIEVQRKKYWRIEVTDLKPKNGGTTSINENRIPPGNARVAMPGQNIQFGETKVLVLAYNGAKADYGVVEPERAPARRKRSVAATIAVDNSPQVEVVEDTKPAPMEVVKKNATARLVVTAGPHKGEEFFLGKGGSEKILFGKKASTKAKNVDAISLSRDTNLKANHARLDFCGNKQCLKIKVTNMSAGAHTFVDVNPVSKDRVAFSGQTITIGDTVMRVESVSS
jgi:hypothetical protein